MIGSSYEGFTVLMALVNPHPALKAAVPMSPMVDGWKGDDWFHNGAFRQTNFDYIYGQTAAKDDSKEVPRGAFDDYANFLKYGSAGDYANHFGFDQLGFWNKISEHPAYDAYWQGQALDPVIAAQPLTVPRMAAPPATAARRIRGVRCRPCSTMASWKRATGPHTRMCRAWRS